ncbi:MAG: DUF5723 family protein [Bacteroidota bacterium]|nr:DUF5723 family protein [Bacteroidota bacterium]
MKKLTLTLIALLVAVQVSAQGFLSFYQLRDIVPQSSNFQPAFIPNNSFTFGLPANLGVTVQGDLRLEELLYKAPGQSDFTVNFDVMNGVALTTNHVNVQTDINLMHLAFKTKQGGFSVFANIRANVDLIYNKDLIEFLANGNSTRIGGTLDFSGSRARIDGYHEVGIGYARRFLDDKLTVGGRIKMVTGMFHGSIQENATLTLTTDETDYSWHVEVQNGTVNTAGFDMFGDSDDYSDSERMQYLMSNGNQTVAFDFGVRYQPLKWLEVEAAVNDIGKIKWTEQSKNYNTEDASFTFSGIDLRNMEDPEQAIQDSIVNKFTSNETKEPFETTMAKRVYLTASAYLTPNDRFSITYFKRDALSGMRPNYAVSFNHKFDKFVVGILGSYRGANNEYNFGANLGTNIGPVQLYLAMDNALVTNRPEQYSKADIRFGLNLMFGYKKWIKKSEIVDLDKL